MTDKHEAAWMGMDVERLVMVGPREVRLEKESLAGGPLAPHEVVLHTRYSLISPGTELGHYTGTSDLGHISARPYPWHPGYASVGTVKAAGEKTGLRPGDLVLAHTPHQSAVRFDVRQRVCVPVPDGMPPHVATVARLGQVGAVSLRLCAARPGDWATVVGLGPVGSCAAQLARCAGLRVVGIETLPQRRALAMRCGISQVIDPHDERAIETLIDETGGGFRLVLECSGQLSGVESGLRLAARRGEVLLVGAVWRRTTDVPATDIIRPIFDKFLMLRSGWEWQLPLYGDEPAGSIAGCTQWVLSCMRDGGLRAADLITDVVAPSEAARTYEGLLEDPAAHCGVVIDWTEGTP